MEILEAVNWQRPAGADSANVRDAVAAILAEIQERGDEAILEYSQRFDGFAPEVIELTPFDECDLAPDLRESLEVAAARIEGFARLQMSMYTNIEGGDQFGRYGQKVLPIERMAAYIPGGRFPLVSTALMTLIPARVAGVRDRVAVSPSRHPAVLAAASLAGATRFVHLGGAQAIAAAALGCAWMDAAHMVVGPGNAYVNEAKGLLQGHIKIDTLAGPSEILVLCDETANPNWVALDVLAQAEHDPMALSVLGSTSMDLLKRVADEVAQIAARFPDKDQGIIQYVHCRDAQDMVALSNVMGPEHLQVDCKEGFLDLDQLQHYGSLFVGAYSAVALGDYCTGPNHTLPTMGNARHKGGLMVGDFLKIVTWQEIDGKRYDGLAKTAIRLAQEEDLMFHRMSLEARLSSKATD